MKDSLTQQLQATEGIPEIGIRITILIVAGFILAVLGVLVYLKMKEEDEKVGIR